jgi:hypothetical protein
MRSKYQWDYFYQAPSGVGSPFFPCHYKADLTPAKAYILYASAFRGLIWMRRRTTADQIYEDLAAEMLSKYVNDRDQISAEGTSLASALK